ncbi:MAG TPA: hypothetical protein DCS07_17460 [Bdellovibrionales bacterium]|nr:MAG: hypothetical protein A2Z97_12390 [Bdellovibrionales bacterium GWB1_52_6]OFZ03738.1 MAG: hypothetical protein A2X97_14370 [Bdellovibrionales bacterium GWA1_52_35]OFZ35444.1 MAG: hypothetical protein A2070_11465 [Bdellovibrionales bacterium GWC1_52_8]HAR44389.1 hypothetical protein [Bdellovibrionales bacterium]HCM38748.1 hypothetical protein [Bdellovibrionales bacterium]
MALGDQYVTWNLEQILVGEPLPGNVYVHIDFRFITFRAEGDTIDRIAFDRLLFKKIRSVFILEQDRPKFQNWYGKIQEAEAATPVEPLAPQNKEFPKVREEAHRKMMDIFLSDHPDKIVQQTLETSKKLVVEVMKFPYAVKTLSQLQSFSRSSVDHSVNVSILSTYLAMQMGYSHALILQHVGMGGLLHDIGKPRIKVSDSETPEVIAIKMKDHPTMGLRILDTQSKVPNEVKMIVAQHHETHDASGYPKKLRGSAIYDLTRIVAIANVFDNIVSNGKGTLRERQKAAINEIDQNLFRKFDPQKLEKALKILKMGV